MRKGALFGIAALGLSGLALAEGVDGADTAWMLVSTALVLLMTPALAFFYGGLVRSKNALNTMMMSFVALAFVGVGWALLGYTLAFGEGGPLLGGLGHLFLRGVGLEAQGGGQGPGRGRHALVGQAEVWGGEKPHGRTSLRTHYNPSCADALASGPGPGPGPGAAPGGAEPHPRFLLRRGPVLGPGAGP